MLIKYFINNNISEVEDKIENRDHNYNNVKKIDHKALTKITVENTVNNLSAKEKEKRRERRR